MHMNVHIHIYLEFNRKFKQKGFTNSRILYKTDPSRDGVKTGYKRKRPRNQSTYSREN